MDKLPIGWSNKELAEVAEIITGNTPPKNDSSYYDNGTIPFVKPPDLGKGIVFETTEMITEKGLNKSRLIPKNSIMVCCIGSLGKIGIAGRDLITNQQINSIVFNPTFIEFRFGYYFSLTLEKYMNETANKAVVAIVNKSTFSKYKILVPPLPEQTRIVNKLDSLFERIDKSIALLEENIKHTEALMASVLDEVFGVIDEDLFKPILDVCSIYNKTINPKDGEIYNYVGLENIETVSGRLVDFSPSTGESIKSSKVIFGKNAVLYGKLRPYLNKVWVSDFEGVSTTEILPFKPNNKILDSNYLAYYLRSPKFVNLVNSNTSGARMPRATTGFFKTIAKVPVPELKVQECIVIKLDVLSKKSNKLITEQQSKLSYLKALKASLLDKAFKGEL